MNGSWWRRADRSGGFSAGILLFAITVPLRLRWRSLPSLAAHLEGVELGAAEPPAEQVAALVARVDRLLARARPVVRGACLTRGITLYRCLRRAGARVSLRFGIALPSAGEPAREDGPLAGHCWLVWRGQPLAERRDPRALYVETWRIEPAPAQTADLERC
jgi:hypothetical protein